MLAICYILMVVVPLVFGWKQSRIFSSCRLSSASTSVREVEQIQKQAYVPTFSTRAAVTVDSSTPPAGEAESSPKVALEELQCIIDDANSEQVPLSVHLRIEYLCHVLQRHFIPIQTVPFLDLVNRGAWLKVYSNTLRPRQSPYLTVNNVTQTLSGEVPGEGIVLENVRWQYHVPSMPVCSGILQVWSNYSYTSRGHMHFALQEHVLVPDTVPPDVEVFVQELQRSVHFESFDPDGVTAEIMFADSRTKIVKLNGGKMLNAINIFHRIDDLAF